MFSQHNKKVWLIVRGGENRERLILFVAGREAESVYLNCVFLLQKSNPSFKV